MENFVYHVGSTLMQLNHVVLEIVRLIHTNVKLEFNGYQTEIGVCSCFCVANAIENFAFWLQYEWCLARKTVVHHAMYMKTISICRFLNL